jgi:hypothetical protein
MQSSFVQRLDEAAGRCVPHPHLIVIASRTRRNDAPTVWRKAHCLDAFGMSFQYAQQFACLDVPDTDGLVIAGGSQAAAVGRERYAVDAFLVPRQKALLELSSFRIPKRDIGPFRSALKDVEIQMPDREETMVRGYRKGPDSLERVELVSKREFPALSIAPGYGV